MPEWFASWFNSPYYHLLYKNRDEEEARRFMDSLVNFLNPSPSARILDLACGRGRHSVYLATKELEITGIDLAEDSIREARHYETQNLSFFQHDMRHLFRTNYFDFIFNLFTSFGYFEHDDDHLRTLKNIHKGLQTGGRFVLDFFNTHWVIAHLIQQETKHIEGVDFYIQKRVENGYIIKTIDFEDKGQTFRYEERVRGFTLDDFEQLFEQAKLHIHTIFGDYNLQPFEEAQSPRLIVVAEKKI